MKRLTALAILALSASAAQATDYEKLPFNLGFAAQAAQSCPGLTLDEANRIEIVLAMNAHLTEAQIKTGMVEGMVEFDLTDGACAIAKAVIPMYFN